MKNLFLKELFYKNRHVVMTVHNVRECVDLIKGSVMTEYITSNKDEEEYFA